MLDTEGAEGKVTRDIDQVAGSKPVNAVSILRHGGCLLRGNWKWRTWRLIKQTSPQGQGLEDKEDVIVSTGISK